MVFMESCAQQRTPSMFSHGMKHITDATTFEGFSNRVTDGSDKDRIEAYGRWLERLRSNQDDL